MNRQPAPSSRRGRARRAANSGEANGSVPEELKAAAVRLFQERGYTGVTIDDIVKEVGVTKGGFYHYFQSKGDLLFELHDEYVTYSIEQFRRVFAEAADDPAKQLEGFVHESFRQVHEFQNYVGLLFDERRSLPPETVEQVEAKKAELRRMLTVVIEDGIRRGVFRESNSHAAALGIFGMCTWAYMWYDRAGSLTHEQLAAEFAELARRGLANGS